MWYFKPPELLEEKLHWLHYSTDAWEAALVATVGLLSIMLKHVHFEVFGHLEGEIAVNTWVRFVFNLHFHGVIWVQLVLQQATQLRENWRQKNVFHSPQPNPTPNSIPIWSCFWKSESSPLSISSISFVCHLLTICVILYHFWFLLLQICTVIRSQISGKNNEFPGKAQQRLVHYWVDFTVELMKLTRKVVLSTDQVGVPNFPLTLQMVAQSQGLMQFQGWTLNIFVCIKHEAKNFGVKGIILFPWQDSRTAVCV